jgi:hypothetical protein
MIIIIFLKLNYGLTQGKAGSPVGLTIDPNQYKDKNDYYHTFKTYSVVGSRPRSG